MPTSQIVIEADADCRLMPDDYVRTHLGPASQRIVAAIVRAILPPSLRFSFDIESELVDFVDRYVGYLPRSMALVLPIGMRLIDEGARLRHGRPMSALSATEARRYLEALSNTSIYTLREAVKGIRGLAMFGLYAHPALQKHIGYEPDPWIRMKVAERVVRFGLRVPDLKEIAATPGGPEGVAIRGDFREELRPDGRPVDYREAFTRASDKEKADAREVIEGLKRRIAKERSEPAASP